MLLHPDLVSSEIIQDYFRWKNRTRSIFVRPSELQARSSKHLAHSNFSIQVSITYPIQPIFVASSCMRAQTGVLCYIIGFEPNNRPISGKSAFIWYKIAELICGLRLFTMLVRVWATGQKLTRPEIKMAEENEWKVAPKDKTSIRQNIEIIRAKKYWA